VKSQFWDIFRASRNAMLLADDDRRYVDGNDAGLELLGVTREQLCQMRIDDLASPAQRADVEAIWDDFMARGNQTGEFALALPDGRAVTFLYSATANVLPGRHLSIFLTAGDGIAPEPAQAGEQLTEREREVVREIAAGSTTGEIASKLFISAPTVETHVRKAMGRLRAKNRAHLIALALQSREI
jgi:PAS domain S-box-containing protein